MSSYKCHWTDCRVVLDDGSIFCKGHENLIANLRNGEMLVVAKTEYQELLAAKETLRELEELIRIMWNDKKSNVLANAIHIYPSPDSLNTVMEFNGHREEFIHIEDCIRALRVKVGDGK